MLGYFGVYGSAVFDRIRNGQPQHQPRFRLGRLPHEIAALNVR